MGRVAQDLTGKKFGKWIVVERVSVPNHIKILQPYWRCICDCGSGIEGIMTVGNLKAKQHKTTCKCPDQFDLTGKIFGKLTVIGRVEVPEHRKGSNATFWKCICDCKNKTEIIAERTALISGRTLSCKCLKSSLAFNNNDPQIVKLSSAKSLFNSSKGKENGYADGNLKFEEWLYLSQQPCSYCGDERLLNCINAFSYRPKNSKYSDFAFQNGNFPYTGLDRINSDFPHNLDNVISSCAQCNLGKYNSSLSDFLIHINKLSINPEFITADQLSYVSKLMTESNSLKLFEIFPCKRGKSYEITLSLRSIKKGAQTRGYELELTDIQCAELFCMPCIYCGKEAIPEEGDFNGIDRVHNHSGYLINNSVSCCFRCNRIKLDYSLNDYLEWVMRIKQNIQHFDLSNFSWLKNGKLDILTDGSNESLIKLIRSTV